MIIGILCLMAIVGFASAHTPTVIPGASQNEAKTCAYQIEGSVEFKLDPVPDGTYSAGASNVLSIVKPSEVPGSEESFDFTSTVAVLGVIVKDGNDGANFYNFGPSGIMGHDYLTTPFDGNKGISNIHFCFAAGSYPPPVVPEFPTVALPVGMLIGLVGLVYFVRTRE